MKTNIRRRKAKKESLDRKKHKEVRRAVQNLYKYVFKNNSFLQKEWRIFS